MKYYFSNYSIRILLKNDRQWSETYYNEVMWLLFSTNDKYLLKKVDRENEEAINDLCRLKLLLKKSDVMEIFWYCDSNVREIYIQWREMTMLND